MTLSGQSAAEMSEDPRALRTRALLKQALLQLLSSKDFGDIGIVELCRRAGVARSSFYEHFAAKADLLDALFTDHLSEIRPSRRAGERLATLSWLVCHVAGEQKLFARAMSGARRDALLPRFQAALTARLEHELTHRGVDDAKPRAAFVIGGAMAWLSSGNASDPDADETLQDMAARVIFQPTNGLNS